MDNPLVLFGLQAAWLLVALLPLLGLAFLVFAALRLKRHMRLIETNIERVLREVAELRDDIRSRSPTDG